MTVYIETTIPSYLTAWRSPDLLVAAKQEATKAWWDEHRQKYDLFIFPIVTSELASGDSNASKKRLDAIRNLPELEVSLQAEQLAEKLVEQNLIPLIAKTDALHIAVAAVHGMDYLLTWNCSHIANATIRHKIEKVCRENFSESPVICTPLELMED